LNSNFKTILIILSFSLFIFSCSNDPANPDNNDAGDDVDVNDIIDDGDGSDADADGGDITDGDIDGDGGDGGTVDPTQIDFSVLTYNIGNPNSDHPTYPLRLSQQEYEDFIASEIQVLQPQVVVLQEVLSAKTCESFNETNPAKTCYEWDTRDRPAKRILGSNYSVVCDAREQVECIGVHVDFGTINGVTLGGYVDTGAETPSLPLPSCNWAQGNCDDDHCDDESTVSGISVTTELGLLKIIHMHPMAQIDAFDSGDPCRTLQIKQVFESNIVNSEPALLNSGEEAIILGDWNLGLEVYSLRTMWGDSNADDVWDQYINCQGCDYRDIDPRNSGTGERYSTSSNLDWAGQVIAIDHVVISDGISGSCIIFDEKGMPGTERFDESYPNLATLEEDTRIDHFAIYCNLTLSVSN
jgi:hypothetical protein